MKKTIEDKIADLEKQVRLCSVISIVAVIVTAIIFGAEFAVAEFCKEADWAESVIKGCIYAVYVMPFVIVIPLFVRVNLKGKLYQAKKQLEEK